MILQHYIFVFTGYKQILFGEVFFTLACREEMEIMGPVRLRDVEEAQSRIVAVIRRLEDAGEIIIARGGGHM